MVRDINRVGKQWRKWDDGQRLLFNEVYKHIMANPPTMFLHPKTKMSRDEFTTVAWNAAWIAAWTAGKHLRGEAVAIAA